MKRSKLFQYVLILSILFLQSCYDENDIISISKDGQVNFETTIIIKDETNQLNFSNIEEASRQMISELQDNGWTTNRTWISKQKPYKFIVTGSGNLKQVGKRTQFYELRKNSDNEYKISFWGGEDSTVGEINRSIEFNYNIFQNNAEVLDASGNDVTKIVKPNSNKIYTIKLD